MRTIQIKFMPASAPAKFSEKLIRADLNSVIYLLNECTADFLHWQLVNDFATNATARVLIAFDFHPTYPAHIARLDTRREDERLYTATFDPREPWDLRDKWGLGSWLDCFRLGAVQFRWHLLHEITHIAFRGHMNDHAHFMAAKLPTVARITPKERAFIRASFAAWIATNDPLLTA